MYLVIVIIILTHFPVCSSPEHFDHFKIRQLITLEVREEGILLMLRTSEEEEVPDGVVESKISLRVLRHSNTRAPARTTNNHKNPPCSQW